MIDRKDPLNLHSFIYKELLKKKREVDYKGCRNCIHQFEPLRKCILVDRGGNGVLHFLCPKWEKKEEH